MASRVLCGPSMLLFIMEAACVLWSVHNQSFALKHGNLTDTLQDIEIAINAADQPRVFDLLLSHGLSISKSNLHKKPATSFIDWCKSMPSSTQYHDRRKARILTPIYELPATGNPLDDLLRPYIIVYSCEKVGLPPISLPSKSRGNQPISAYVALSKLHPDLAISNDKSPLEKSNSFVIHDCTVPSFTSLLKSEMHTLLMHAEPHSPVWGQHMAQLSELVHSRACARGLDSLEEIVSAARFNDFISWFRSSLKGKADYEGLKSLQASYRKSRTVS